MKHNLIIVVILLVITSLLLTKPLNIFVEYSVLGLMILLFITIISKQSKKVLK